MIKKPLFIKKSSALAPPKSLMYRLHRHLSDMDEHRSMGTIHASELTKTDGICPRFYALTDVTEISLPLRDKSTSEEVTWEFGRQIQDMVVNWYADAGMAICDWRCLNTTCGYVKSLCKRPATCPKCSSKSFKPVEPRFISKKTGASAGIDMLVEWDPASPWQIVEIKSIDKDEFKKLAMPLAEHRLRTNFYMRIVAEAGVKTPKPIDFKTGWVFYTSKGGYGTSNPELRKWGISDYFSPFKEYTVRREDAMTNEIAHRSSVVNDFRNGKVGMPCGVCPHSMCERAKKCPARKACFSGDFPPTYDWRK